MELTSSMIFYTQRASAIVPIEYPSDSLMYFWKRNIQHLRIW
jgi:hypothetical protein